MDYNDWWVFNQIKRINERISAFDSIITDLAARVRVGDGPPVGDNPGVPGKIYYDRLNGVIYQQQADGSWK